MARPSGSSPRRAAPPLETPPPIESLADIVSQQRASGSWGRQSGSHAAAAAAAGADDEAVPHRDESRWSGFHLWHTEQQQQQAAQQHEAQAGASLTDTDVGASDVTARPAPHAPAPRTWSDWVRGLPGRLAAATKRESRERRPSSSVEPPSSVAVASEEDGRMSQMQFVVLTAAIAGAQMAWCLELAYGTPYLVSLGLSKSATSLVWLAGPASGMVAQPLVGSLSDRSTSRYRRRAYIVASTVLVALSTLVVAFSGPLASFIVDAMGNGLGDWDPERQETLGHVDRALAISGFWVLDLALNALQAAARALILDAAPASQQTVANAWQGRMTALGNVIGYSVGYADLGRRPWLRWIGGGQFRKLALVALLGMALGVGITCAGTPERQIAESSAPRRGGIAAELQRSVRDIWHAIVRLPRPVRRVCATQMFAFMGWFPMLFYASSYIAEISAYERMQAQKQPQVGDKDAERGSLALLLYALVALVAGMLLPYAALAVGNQRPKLLGANDQLQASPHVGGEDGEDDSEAHLSPATTSRTQRLARGLREGMTLRSIWTASLLLLACLMACTLLPLHTRGATALIAAVGVSWAVASWVPFALVMEFAKEAEQGSSPFEFETDWHGATRTAQRRESLLAAAGRSAAREQLNAALGDCAPLRDPESEPAVTGTFLARGTEVVEDSGAPGDSEGGLGGTILGIHNLAIVLPQFVVAIVGALIFRAADAAAGSDGAVRRPELGGTAWVLRYGGAMALIAALLTRYVPLTQTERERRGERVGPHFDDEVASDEGAAE